MLPRQPSDKISTIVVRLNFGPINLAVLDESCPGGMARARGPSTQSDRTLANPTVNVQPEQQADCRTDPVNNVSNS